MSSTNRSNARDEHIADYYVTPVDKILDFLIEFEDASNIFDGYPKILDPCAGGDLNHPMSYPKAINKFRAGIPITTIDVRDDSLADIKSNYLTYNLDFIPDIIITNPPFNQAMEIIEKSLQDVAEGGYVIMLLRLNFLETKIRKPFFDKQMPEYIYVYSQRIGFTDKGGTDSVAYAHYCFRKGYNPEYAKIKVI